MAADRGTVITQPEGRDPKRFKVGYTRRRDRILATLWPPKRRDLRMMQAVADAGAEDIAAHLDRISLDLRLYGNAFVKMEPHE